MNIHILYGFILMILFVSFLVFSPILSWYMDPYSCKIMARTLLFQILVYCRSSMPPQFQLPPTLKLFTLDVIYIHDKPGPDNCPQTVFDTLVEALERVSEFEGYIFESGQGLTRSLFRHMCVLLSHPPQRCIQDELDIPRSLTKKSPVADTPQGDDNVVISSQ